ncbi:hypothetical protein [Paenibacillus sp. SN-8-1]|uniref:hypothetical protein n=1 Tax=Paenibacillus sp. SN-8-1 TaxID=3435409 RepID=UPI003D9A3329
MTTKYTGDHIENHDVQYYLDSIFQKISQEIVKRECTSEPEFLMNCLYQKFKIQFFSIMQLTYKRTINPSGKYSFLDIASIQTLIRSCFETYLTFEYIYNQSSNESEIECKVLLYKRGSTSEFLRYDEDTKEYIQALQELQQIDLQLKENEYFSLLCDKEIKVLKKSWRPSWMKIVDETILSKTNNAYEYNQQSMYAHNSYHALMNLHHYYLNLDQYDVDATNVQLFIITSLFSKSLIEWFKISPSLFTVDELGIMGEFITLAKRERHEIEQ